MLMGGKLDWRVWVITLRVLRWPGRRRERRGRRETWGVSCHLEALLKKRKPETLMCMYMYIHMHKQQRYCTHGSYIIYI